MLYMVKLAQDVKRSQSRMMCEFLEKNTGWYM